MVLDKNILIADRRAVVADWPSLLKCTLDDGVEQTISVDVEPMSHAGEFDASQFLDKQRIQVGGATPDFKGGILPKIRKIVQLQISGETAFSNYCIVDVPLGDDVSFLLTVERSTDKTGTQGII